MYVIVILYKNVKNQHVLNLYMDFLVTITELLCFLICVYANKGQPVYRQKLIKTHCICIYAEDTYL